MSTMESSWPPFAGEMDVKFETAAPPSVSEGCSQFKCRYLICQVPKHCLIGYASSADSSNNKQIFDSSCSLCVLRDWSRLV